jgi:hypothetical protein
MLVVFFEFEITYFGVNLKNYITFALSIARMFLLEKVALMSASLDKNFHALDYN